VGVRCAIGISHICGCPSVCVFLGWGWWWVRCAVPCVPHPPPRTGLVVPAFGGQVVGSARVAVWEPCPFFTGFCSRHFFAVTEPVSPSLVAALFPGHLSEVVHRGSGLRGWFCLCFEQFWWLVTLAGGFTKFSEFDRHLRFIAGLESGSFQRLA